MLLRISLGALFGLVLALPFGVRDFLDFCRNIAAESSVTLASADSAAGKVTKQALMLLLPFVLGFSTTLVILVLNRLVDAVQSFFGKGTERKDEHPPLTHQSEAVAVREVSRRSK